LLRQDARYRVTPDIKIGALFQRMNSFLRLVLPMASFAVLVLCSFAAFIGLGSSSFWTDEIFTSYFAAPDLANPVAVVLRSSEDVHPPGYYLTVWFATQLTALDFVTVSRGLSALMAVISLGIVMWAPLSPVSRNARLAAAAFAATSIVWFDFSQEARSYALCFVLVASITGVALRCLHRLWQNGRPTGWLAALAFLTLLACYSHYYAVLLAGGVFTMLLVFCRSRWSALAVSVAGLFVLAGTGAYMVWHLPRMVADIDATWFRADATFILGQIRSGLDLLSGGGWNRGFALLLVAVLMLSVLQQGRHALGAVLTDNSRWVPIAFLAGVFVLSVCYGVLVTRLFTPMLSERLFVLLAPVGWIGLAYLLDLAFRVLAPRGMAGAASIGLALTLLGACSIVLERGADKNQAWRHSALAVAEMEGCLSATLPVMWWEQAYFGADDPEYFYGFYLQSDPAREWLKVPRDNAAPALRSLALRDIVRAAASGARTCKLVLWSVHMHGRTSPEDMKALLQSHLPAGSDDRVEIEILLPSDGSYGSHALLFKVVQGDTPAD